MRTRALCDCGNKATVKKNQEMICERCARIEEAQTEKPKRDQSNYAKYRIGLTINRTLS